MSTDSPIALSVVIPAFNEGSNVTAVVEATVKTLDAQPCVGAYELLLVDDGSRDDTPQRVDELAARYRHVVAIHHPVNRGFGAALRTGFARTKGERVSLLSADGEFGADQIVMLLEQMGTADLIVSRRERPVASPTRTLLSSGVNVLIRHLLGISPEGITGIYVVRGDLLRSMRLHADTGLVNIEVVIECRQARCEIRSAVIQVRPRLSGESKVTNVATMTRTFWELVKLGMLRRRHKPASR